MIHREAAPSPRYLALFETLCDRYAPRLAREVRQLAQQLVSDLGYSASPITLVSLVRAGTPAGALLRRALVDYEDQPCHHFSVSIIRDRGIDTTALDYLLDQVGVDAKRTVFVDAWTAKGVITRELRSDMTRYNNTRRAKGKSTIQPAWRSFLILAGRPITLLPARIMQYLQEYLTQRCQVSCRARY